MRCTVTNVPGTQGLKRYMYVATAPVVQYFYGSISDGFFIHMGEHFAIAGMWRTGGAVSKVDRVSRQSLLLATYVATYM